MVVWLPRPREEASQQQKIAFFIFLEALLDPLEMPTELVEIFGSGSANIFRSIKANCDISK